MASLFGVQSYCFRKTKDNTETAELVKQCGLDTVEVCRVQIDFSDTSTHKPAIEAYKNAGVKIASIGVNGIGADEAEARKLFEFARAAGLRVMSVDFAIDAVPECFTLADRLAEEYDINLGIHNHGGRHWLGSAQALNWVFSKTSKRIGLSLDTAWALDARENPVELAKRFADRLHIIHIKDFVFDRARTPEDVIVGTGNLELPALDAVLAGGGFTGPAILEYEGDVDDPVPALKKCVDAVRGAMPRTISR